MDNAALRAFREGRFNDADLAARTDGSADIHAAILRLEIDYFLARTQNVRRDGKTLFGKVTDDSLLASRCASILAAQHCDDGDFDSGLGWSQRAVDLAERSGNLPQLSRAICALLERTYNRSIYSASLPLALSARRISIRCSEPHIAAATHLTFARLEARIGNFTAARRHFALTRELLSPGANLWLSTSVDLDESSLLSLVGDMRGALKIGARAIETAEQSGWVKGIVAAAANCAFFCVSLGELGEAERHLHRAVEQPFKSPSYKLALDETQARLAFASGNYELAERLITAHDDVVDAVQPWYELSAQETLVRVLLAQRRWDEAYERSNKALALAEKAGAEPFLSSLRIVRAEALVGMGKSLEQLDLPLGINTSDASPSLTRSFLETLGKALLAGGSVTAGVKYIQRSSRMTESPHMLHMLSNLNVDPNDPLSIPDLDAAVALIELGGHPHILAREALASIEAAGCARTTAAIATGAGGDRAIEVHGWTEREALAAARKSDQYEVVPLGEHRDEPWQLVIGETGTGKEMLARAIHRASDRADKPMLPFNCTAVPRDMIESQLFGYRKGAFTGADTSFAGVIRSAAGGTLFLDEIAEVPLEVQPKLLRFLETHEIHPLGELQPIKVDVRVIVATNGRLEQLVAEGRFREDLFYRLNVVRMKLPPLRERREEIPPLVNHYLRKYGDEQKKGRLTLSDETLEYLLLYAWPGNLRQLANEVRRMVAMAEPDSTLTPAHLSPEIQTSRRTIPAIPAADPEVRVRIDQPLPAAVQILEQTMVKSALDRTHGRVEEAARMLGISRKGLFLKRRRWGISHQPSSN